MGKALFFAFFSKDTKTKQRQRQRQRERRTGCDSAYTSSFLDHVERQCSSGSLVVTQKKGKVRPSSQVCVATAFFSFNDSHLRCPLLFEATRCFFFPRFTRRAYV